MINWNGRTLKSLTGHSQNVSRYNMKTLIKILFVVVSINVTGQDYSKDTSFVVQNNNFRLEERCFGYIYTTYTFYRNDTLLFQDTIDCAGPGGSRKHWGFKF